ncbi:MAG: hypothetical protein ACI8UZ_002828 [Akkermansiaceae bacterium]|jgi:hypothetical protein
MAELPQRLSSSPSRGSSVSTRWFCKIGDKKHGPMEFRELRLKAMDQELLGHHQVWRSGTETRQEAISIVGLIPPSKKKVAELPPSDLSDEDPYATPKVRTIADGPPGGLYLPHLHRTNYLIFLFALVLSGGLFYAGWKIIDSDTKPILFSLAGMALTFWLFLAIVYLYRAWEMMLMFGAPINGSKAVRFLFFPVFNALWCFVVLFGWARLWNRSVQTHPGLTPASQVWRPFFFLFPILFLISQAMLIMYLFIREWPISLRDQSHQITLVTWAITLLVGLLCWFQLCQSINFLARKKS